MMASMRANGPLRILLVDDHELVRTGLRMLIESHSGLSVVGEVRDSSEAVRVAARQKPDIVLLDLDLGGQNGLDLIPQLLSVSAKARILVLTGVQDSEAHRRAVR